MLYYSASVGGFLDDDIHSAIPSDAVEITAARHAELLEAQSRGMLLCADAQGRPIATERPAPTADDLGIALRERRDQLLRACDFTQLTDAPLSVSQRADWATYRQALRDLPETVTDLSSVTWPIPPAKD